MKSSSYSDARKIINEADLSRLQITVIIITMCLNALDGFDLLSISFAAPGIANEWGINRAALGVVLAMELIGMGIGSLLLGGIADKIGRRPTILICLTIITIGMFLATSSKTITELATSRILTGLGIGGMIAALNAVITEFSNLKRRNFTISLMVIGYAIGGVVGGLIATQLLQHYEWRSVFYFGSFVTACSIPLFYFFVPESLHWLTLKQPKNALLKINNTLNKMGHASLDSLPDIAQTASQSRNIFSKPLISTLLLMTTIYFLHVITFYYSLKWIPKLVVDMGFNPSSAGNILVWLNVGGVIGGALFGFLTMKLDFRKTLSLALLGTFIFVSIFGRTSANLNQLALYATLVGFFSNASMAGMYILCAKIFPTDTLASGTGFVVGIGRAGAVLSPIMAGLLFSKGYTLPIVSVLMGLGSLLAIASLFFLKPQQN